MNKAQISDKIVEDIGEIADSDYMVRLAEALESAMMFSGALRAVSFASITAKSLFLRGYYHFRTGRLGQAEDDLLLARRMGYPEEIVGDILENLCEVRNRKRVSSRLDPVQVAQNVQNSLQTGMPDTLEWIEQYKVLFLSQAEISMNGSDVYDFENHSENNLLNPVELYSMESIIYYNQHQYQDAALSVDAGLLRYGDHFDLLYNGGFINRLLGNDRKAAELYEKALEMCKDPEMAREIQKEISEINQISKGP